MMKKTFLALILSICICGCFSNKSKTLAISSVYPFEGRYDSTHEIVIDGDNASIKEKDSIWILSNHTLYYLLTSVSDAPDKIVFGKKAYALDKTEKELQKASVKIDDFDDEEFVWEKWSVSTNKVTR